LAFNNVAAYREFDPRYPIASRYVDEDFNRLWHPVTLDGPRQSTELARARVLRPLVDSADFLLDLHSMQYATAPLMLAGLLERSRELARRIGIPELIMCDPAMRPDRACAIMAVSVTPRRRRPRY
jgi:predicted deacylase